MTYLPNYSIAGTAHADMTLYEATKKLREIGRSGDARDITHVRHRSGRPVSFWCAWRGTVRPMFGANDAEASVVADWYGN
jgi:hypothetical protein